MTYTASRSICRLTGKLLITNEESAPNGVFRALSRHGKMRPPH